MRVLVTGGTGFIGAWTTKAFVDAGHDVRLLVRDPERVKKNLVPIGVDGVDTVTGDVTGDGHDDVIVTVQDSPALPTSRGVVVIPTAVASPAFTPMLDTPCQ